MASLARPGRPKGSKRARAVYVGARLISLRLARRQSQDELARAADVSLGTVRAVEGNKVSPTITTLTDLARGLRVDASALLEPGPVPEWRLFAEAHRLTVPQARQLVDELRASGHEPEVANEDLVRGTYYRLFPPRV